MFTYNAELHGLNVRGNIQVLGELQSGPFGLCIVLHGYRRQFQEFHVLSTLHGNAHACTQFYLDNDIPAREDHKYIYPKIQGLALISHGFKFTDISSMLEVHPKKSENEARLEMSCGWEHV